MFADGAQRCWRLASTVLGWSPDQFWASTPTELSLSLPDGGGTWEGVSKNDLQALAAKFPDVRDR